MPNSKTKIREMREILQTFAHKLKKHLNDIIMIEKAAKAQILIFYHISIIKIDITRLKILSFIKPREKNVQTV
jgi:hypothetical protein